MKIVTATDIVERVALGIAAIEGARCLLPVSIAVDQEMPVCR